MEILMVILSFVAIFFAGATWWQKRRGDKEKREKEKIEKEQKEKEEEFFDTLNEISRIVQSDVREILQNDFCDIVRREEIEKERENIMKVIDKQISVIGNKIDDLSYKVTETDKKNIRNNVIEFAEDLRNGNIRSKMAYKNILAQYDYYKKELHGNSYIDEEVEFIKEEMKRF